VLGIRFRAFASIIQSCHLHVNARRRMMTRARCFLRDMKAMAEKAAKKAAEKAAAEGK
jgi:hypothetical protein